MVAPLLVSLAFDSDTQDVVETAQALAQIGRASCRERV